MNEQSKRDEFIKDKLRKIRNLLAHWKKYTDVLNMTSAEIGMKDLDKVNAGKVRIDLANFSKANIKS